jgi:transcriptional regulator with XRE-family HTH domain
MGHNRERAIRLLPFGNVVNTKTGQMEKFCERLRAERKRLGLRQDQMGVSGKTQWLYENGGRIPDAEYLARFAALGADVLYVITGQRTGGTLAPDEAALLDNYRHIPDENRHTVEEVGAALAQWAKAVKAATGGRKA